MSSDQVTGRTEEELEEMREQYDKEKPFDVQYCLAPIPRQPDSYDGPQRYCINREVMEVGSTYKCKHHGGHLDTDNLVDAPPDSQFKHGLYATRKWLMRNFDEKDEALYNWIVKSYPESYDINIEEDPVAAYDVHRVAVEIVRAEKGRGYILDEGEVQEKDRYTDDGQIVIDEHGEVVTEKSAHYLADVLHKQDNKVTKLHKALGITREQRLRREKKDETVQALTEGFSKLGDAFLRRDDTDYDPSEEPWKEEDTDNDET